MNTMLGYELKDVETMMAAINVAIDNLPTKASFKVVRNELQNAYDMFDGLIMEGYFD